MTSTIFATPRLARGLEAAGAERRQAETHAEALRPVAADGRDELATIVFVIGLRVFGVF